MAKFLALSFLLLFTACKKEEEYNPFSGEAEKKSSILLFKIDGKEITQENMPQELRIAQYRIDMENYLKTYNSWESFAIRMALQKDKGWSDPSNSGAVPSLNQFVEDSIDKKEVEATYKKLKPQFDAAKKEEKMAKAEIKYNMLVNKVTPMYIEQRKKLYTDDRIHVNLLPPDIRKTRIPFVMFPRLGDIKKPLELMAITNYNCKRCRSFNKQIQKLYKNYGNSLSYVHINHAFRPKSVNFDLLLAAQCMHIGEKSKYWKFHEMVFAEKSFGNYKIEKREESRKKLGQILDGLGVPSKRIFECMSNDQNKKIMSKSILRFRDVGIKELPVFYLNGRQLILVQEEDGLEPAFKNMLKSLNIKL